MPRAEPSSTGRVRGKYVARACNHCRQRKTKCDGEQPTCGTCRQQGHECLWGTENAKKPHNKQYVDGLRTVKQALEQRNKDLENENRRLRAALGLPSPVDDRQDEAGLVEAAEQVLAGPSPGPSSNQSYKEEEDDDDDDIAAIAAPLHHLHLQDGNLQLLGPTSVLRLGSEEPAPTPHNHHMPDNADQYIYALGQHNATVDWQRYLPKGVYLTQQEHDLVLTRFFKFFSSWHHRVNERLFLRDMYRVLYRPPLHPPPKLSHYSPMLHNAIMSVAAAFADDKRVNNAAARQAFADKARESLEAECDRPTLSAVIALSVLANYHSSRKSPSLGYMYFGISARISQALGFGVDCSPWVAQGLISPESVRDRNWGFWATFCQDTTWCLYVGRDHSVSSLQSVKNVPLPFDDHSNLGRTFYHTCTLLMIAREIIQIVNNYHNLGIRQDDSLTIAQIDFKLGQWLEELPLDINITKANINNSEPHQLMLMMTYHWLIVVLHRPFYRKKTRDDQHANEVDHVKRCNRAATDIMELAESWRTRFTVRFVPITFIQVVSAAGTVFVLDALQATAGPRLATQRLKDAMEKTKKAIGYMAEVGETFASAAGMAQILKGLLDHQVQARLARRGAETASITTNGVHAPSTSSTTPEAGASYPQQPPQANGHTNGNANGADLAPLYVPSHGPANGPSSSSTDLSSSWTQISSADAQQTQYSDQPMSVPNMFGPAPPMFVPSPFEFGDTYVNTAAEQAAGTGYQQFGFREWYSDSGHNPFGPSHAGYSGAQGGGANGYAQGQQQVGMGQQEGMGQQQLNMGMNMPMGDMGMGLAQPGAQMQMQQPLPVEYIHQAITYM